MKKLMICLMAAVAVMACNNGKQAEEKAQHERDSLMQVIQTKEAELNDMMGMINEVQEGFRQINEAEGRITVADSDPEHTASSADIIRENMNFIQETMQQNRDKISQLQQKLRTSKVNADKLKQTIENLTLQLEEQSRKVQELQASLAEKDIVIAEQGDRINALSEDVSALSEDNSAKSKTIASQDEALHAAWFVFGTKAELKEQKILEKGDVLKNGDFNKDYFTKIDIRVDKLINLYSKNATILTSHPAGSYVLGKDQKDEYVLQIKDPDKFWSTSKYLVIQVK